MTTERKESNITDVYINLTDENDNSPVFEQQAGYQTPCNKTLGIGEELLKVSAADRNDNFSIACMICVVLYLYQEYSEIEVGTEFDKLSIYYMSILDSKFTLVL